MTPEDRHSLEQQQMSLEDEILLCFHNHTTSIGEIKDAVRSLNMLFARLNRVKNKLILTNGL